ncbi:MAG: helix-turn-helix domain-containing protein [Candidatus Bathyarchaeota archaeon]|nr:MAG: helix-turn-helix domain-containing protein [Candidatus Bathyarchaeota archaeon]
MDTAVDKLMDVTDAAVYFGLTEFTIRKMAREGEIPAAKIGRAYRFRKEDIDAFIKKQYKAITEEQ